MTTRLQKKVLRLATDPELKEHLRPILDSFLPSNVRDALVQEMIPLVEETARRLPKNQVAKAVENMLDMAFAEKHELYHTLIYYQNSHENEATFLTSMKNTLRQWLKEQGHGVLEEPPEPPKQLEKVKLQRRIIEHPDGTKETVENWDAARATEKPAAPPAESRTFLEGPEIRARVAARYLGHLRR